MFNDYLLDFCNDVYNQHDIDAWREGCILPFPKKGDLGIPSNYRSITLTAIAAKIYNKLILNRIQPEMEKILRKNQNGFRKSRSTTGQILTERRLIEGINAKNLEATLLFVDFSKAFDSIDRTKIEEILYPILSDNVKDAERLLHLLGYAASIVGLMPRKLNICCSIKTEISQPPTTNC